MSFVCCCPHSLEAMRTVLRLSILTTVGSAASICSSFIIILLIGSSPSTSSQPAMYFASVVLRLTTGCRWHLQKTGVLLYVIHIPEVDRRVATSFAWTASLYPISSTGLSLLNVKPRSLVPFGYRHMRLSLDQCSSVGAAVRLAILTACAISWLADVDRSGHKARYCLCNLLALKVQCRSNATTLGSGERSLALSQCNRQVSPTLQRHEG